MTDMMPIAAMVGTLFSWVVGLWLVLGLTLAVVMSVIQERKIWLPKSLPSVSVWGLLKVAVFNLVWCTLCLVCAMLVVAKFILTLGQSDPAYDSHYLGERFVAHACLLIFVGRVELCGAEHLPPAGERRIPAPIYIANHASQIDVAAVYFIQRRFKWIAKQSILFLPGVGQLMGLSQHVFIQRKGKNKKSVSNLFEKSGKAVLSGIPMFFFPQGTRFMSKRLPFKDGAYIVATENRAPIIPISVDIPRNAWNSAYPLSLLVGGQVPVVTLTVHKEIPVGADTDKEELKRKSMEQVYSAVPTILKAEAQETAAKQ